MSAANTEPRSPLHRNTHHESATGHVTGGAVYVDDMPGPVGTLQGHLVVSPHRHARNIARDATAARKMPGVHAVLFADAIPGKNRIGAIVHDEPVLAEDEVFHIGQPVALVVAETIEAAMAAAALVEVAYAPLPTIDTIEDAIAAQAWHGDAHIIARGDTDAAWAKAAFCVQGELRTPAQDHFYLETQAALAVAGEANTWQIWSSTQHPTEVQAEVATVLGLGSQQVVVEVPRMGGGFGGKESQSTFVAALAAVGALATGRAVKLRLERGEDMRITGNRHPYLGRYSAVFDASGLILGLRVALFADGGWSQDLSLPVLDRALFHLDNAYYVPALRFEGRACRTHRPSNTAFRGFGGPQGVAMISQVMNEAAERLGMEPAEVRALNYYGEAPRDRTPYGHPVTHNRLARMHAELMASSDYTARKAAIEAFNAGSRFIKRGVAFQPVKFGISFTKSVLNQAGALVHVYTDGTVQLSHGGTEMGQGLHTKMRAIAAHELGAPVDAIRVMRTSTDKVPNTSATAASSGSDLNGQAVKAACSTIRERMRPIAAAALEAAPEAVEFVGGVVRAGAAQLTFAEVALQCWLEQVSLSSTGYYRTPGIAYDHATGQGKPFHYYTYGAAVCEVELNGLTGEHRLTRTDILHDVGDSLVPSIDLGQVEGAFVQGTGWLTSEEVIFADDGRLLTAGASTYKIPTAGDAALDFRVALLTKAAQDDVIHGSKAVGEPPFVLGLGVLSALRHAVAAFGDGPLAIELPATPEHLLRAIGNRQG